MLEFKPLKQKRGSILLIVVSMMSVLIMLAQALLLSVSVTQQTQVTNFYDKQAYQTSLSVTDIVAATLMSGNSNSQAILNQLKTPGDTLSTGSNGFSALGEINGAEQLNKVGAYRVDITRKDDTKNGSGDTLEVYEIAVLTDFNGMKETVTSTIYVKVTKDKFVGFDRMFTATGYGTGDVFINNSVIMNPAYFDNEYTVVSGDSGSPITYSNVICGGTLQIETETFMPTENIGPRDLVVRGDLRITSKNITLKMSGGQVFIGGDIIATKDLSIEGNKFQPVKDTSGVERNTSVYILGDVVSSATIKFDKKVENVYINGDLKSKNLYVEDGTNVYVKGNVIVNKIDKGSNRIFYGGTATKEDGAELSGPQKMDDPISALSAIQIVKSENNQLVYHTMDNGTTLNVSAQNIWDLINTLTAERVYPKFRPSEKVTNPTKIKIKFSDNQSAHVIDRNQEECFIIEDIDLSSFKHEQKINGVNQVNLVPTIIINADKKGSDKKEPLTIKLMGNSSDKKEFSWAGNTTYKGNNKTVNVLILGESPVFFEIEEGVKYVANIQDFVAHKDWYYITPDAHKEDISVDENNLDNSFSKAIVNTQFENNQSQVRAYINLAYTKEQAIEAGDEKLEGTISYKKLWATGKENYKMVSEKIHNNVYLISDSEFADIDLNAPMSFFGGFVYAPYMTFKTIGGNEGGQGIAIAGGLIVSDYILDDKRGYMFFKPSIDISELFDEYLAPITKREWKKASYG